MLTFLKALPLAAKIGIPVVLVCLSVIGVLKMQLDHTRDMVDRVSFRSDSVIASMDSTRKLDLSVLTQREVEKAQLGDSLQVVQRLMVQSIGRNDALERALGVERRARIALTATIDSLRLVVVAPGPVVETPEGVRSQTFQIDTLPFQGTVTATLPKPPASGSLALNIGVAPATFNVRVSCGTAPPGSTVRPAVVTATGPSWLTMTLGTMQQTPEICNQETLAGGARRGPSFGVGCAIGPSLALVDKVVQAAYIGASCGLTIKP